MKINNEAQILNKDFRQSVISEIFGDENIQRKRESEDRYKIFKDQTKEFVLDRFVREQGIESANEIKYRLSNISFCKKIIQKKAQVYDHGVKRIVLNKQGNDLVKAQAQIDKLTNILNINASMTKANEYSELQKNTTVRVMPYINPATGKYRYKLFPLNPHFYDVIEDAQNPEVPLVHIFSYFHDTNDNEQSSSVLGQRSDDNSNFNYGDNVDQIIADAAHDDFVDNVRLVWWSHNYHFTTNKRGEITPESPQNLANPIAMSSFVDFSIDQDNHYWAIGGDDIIDTSILLNMLLTDLYYISRYQGLGVFYFFGRGVPKSIKIGPKEVLTLDIREGDPTPQIGFANSNAPLDVHMRMIEQQLAFTLSTNNIQATSIQGSLTAAAAQSGIQEIVQRSDNVGEIEAQQQYYEDGEPKIFKIIAKWHNLYLKKGLLDDDLAEIGMIDEDIFVFPKFEKPQVMLSDKEKLEVWKMREEMNIDSEIDIIQKDNEMMTREEAEAKFRQVLADKLIKSSMELKDIVNGNKKSDVQSIDSNDGSEEIGQGEAEI